MKSTGVSMGEGPSGKAAFATRCVMSKWYSINTTWELGAHSREEVQKRIIGTEKKVVQGWGREIKKVALLD